MNRLIEKTFENRGYTSDYLREISVASYDTLKDIDVLSVRLKDLHDDQSPITVYPDFDILPRLHKTPCLHILYVDL